MMNSLELMVEEVKKRMEVLEAVEGPIQDLDTILANIIEDIDVEESGIGLELLNIWEHATDRVSVERLFEAILGISFVDYLEYFLELEMEEHAEENVFALGEKVQVKGEVRYGNEWVVVDTIGTVELLDSSDALAVYLLLDEIDGDKNVNLHISKNICFRLEDGQENLNIVFDFGDAVQVGEYVGTVDAPCLENDENVLVALNVNGFKHTTVVPVEHCQKIS